MINQDEAAGLSWARVEVYRDRRHWLPLRSLEDDDDLDDQERRVKFSDIRNALFCLPDDQLCIRLLFSFLRYLGAPTLSDSVPGDIVSDEFFQRQILSHGQLFYSAQTASVPKNITDALNSLQDCRFYQPLPPACGQTYDVDRRLGTCPKMNHQFVSRLLQQLLEKAEVSGALHDPDAKLSFATNGIYYFRSRLFFLKQGGVQISRSHKDYKEGKKFAKAVLKRPELRGNVIPWCEFGRLEAEAAGATAAVNEIFTNCLALGHSLRAKADDFKVFACMFYVLKEMAMVILFASDMESEYPQLARAFISAVGTFLANEEAPSLGATFEPVNLLRIRNELIDLLGKHAAAYRDDIYAYYGWSWGESAFFDVGVVVSAFELAVGDVTSSLAALENVIETMQTSLGPHIEHYDPTVVDEPRIRRRRKDLHSIHLFRIQIFAKFATREQSLTKNLIQFRQFISSGLLDFPSSVELLYIWYHVESMKLGIHRPSDNLSSTGSVLARQIFSILYDLSRETRISNLHASTTDADSSNTAKVMTTGLHHRIRKKFSAAVEKYPQCPLLWRMYLAFEKKMDNEVEYENVFYRAIDHLPHVKCLYIDAIIYMPYRIDEYLRTMSDRDVRLRVPIEEIRMLLNIPIDDVPESAPAADVKHMKIDDDEDPDVEEIPIVIKEDRVRRSNSRELSPDRMDDVASSGDDDEYDSVPAYEAPHKRTEDGERRRRSSRKRPKGVQYPDPEFDRRWEKKRREAEDAKQMEIEERRRRRDDERRERYRSHDDYSDDDDDHRDYRSRSRSRERDYRRSISPARQRDRRSPSYERDRRRDSRDRGDYDRSPQYSRARSRSLSRDRRDRNRQRSPSYDREYRRSSSHERSSRRSPKRSRRSPSYERKSRRSRSAERSNSRKMPVKYDYDDEYGAERYDPARPTRSPVRDEKRKERSRRTRSRSPQASSRYYSSRR